MRKRGTLPPVIPRQELQALARVFNSVCEHPAEWWAASVRLSSDLFSTALNKQPGSAQLQRMTFLIF